VLVGVFVLAAFRMPQRSQRSRYEVKADDRLQQAIADYQDADVLLEQLHIPDDAIILGWTPCRPIRLFYLWTGRAWL
jgi:hypothetical protein